MLLRNREIRRIERCICNVSMKREKERWQISSTNFRFIVFRFLFHRGHFYHVLSSIFSNMPFNVLLFFFLKRDFYVTHIHTYTHIHTMHRCSSKRKKKGVSFRDFSYFELLKRKKISIHPLIGRGKKIFPGKKRLVE